MNRTLNNRRPGFSLVELVIVIVIIGIIAAIAVPRFSSATTSANQKQAKASAVILQNALDLFIAEHAAGALAGTGAGVVTQLTNGTKYDGTAGTDYGPYMRAMPANLTIGDTADGLAIDTVCDAADAPCGWDLTTADQSISSL
jgi:prepilin-type N-terminal cleavage/methylation domain-containing protein